MAVARHKIQKPDYRNNGKYQFTTWYTASGSEACVHLSAEEIAERCRAQVGEGTLVDDGEDLWWEQTLPEEGVACPQCGHSATEFLDGVCTDCAERNQRELDEYTARCEWWYGLTEKARDLIIQAAIKRAP